MKPALVFVAAVLTASFAASQVPAPDFWIEPVTAFSSPNWGIAFHVQGAPPSAPLQVLFTYDDPFSTPPEQIIIYPFLAGNTDNMGSFITTLSVPSWQGPLPDVWFGCVVMPPGQPPVIAGVTNIAAMNGGPSTLNCNPSEHKMLLGAARNPAGSSPVGRIDARGKVCPNDVVILHLAFPGGATANQQVQVAPDGSFQWSSTAIQPGTAVTLLLNGQPNGLETAVVP